MTLHAFYRAYIDCLNRQDWDELGQYVSDDARHNGRPLGLPVSYTHLTLPTKA